MNVEEPPVEEIDVSTAHAMWAAGDVVVDVRLPEEYSAGHIPGARNIPLRDLATRERELPPGQIVAVCSTGNRSLRGAVTLARLGRTAYSLGGGTKAWSAAGHRVVNGGEPGSRRRPSLLRRLMSRR